LNNEYDLSEIKQVLQANNRTIICADIPGAGKSTSIKNCGFELLFVTPYNKLSQELRKDGFDSVTLHNLLGMGITDEQNKKAKQKDISKFEAVGFDELMLYNVDSLTRIYRYMNSNQDKHFYATGDLDQLLPFDIKLNNIKDIKSYLQNCIDQLFPNKIILKENKRLKTDEDKQRLNELKKDIFDYKQDLIKVLVKHGIIKTKKLR